MNVDKIGRIGSGGYEPRKTPPPVKNETTLGSDTVTISEQAQKLSMQAKLSQEVSAITKQILQEPESQERVEKLKEIKEKLKNGEYDNLSPEVLSKVSDRILDVFLG